MKLGVGDGATLLPPLVALGSLGGKPCPCDLAPRPDLISCPLICFPHTQASRSFAHLSLLGWA